MPFYLKTLAHDLFGLSRQTRDESSPEMTSDRATASEPTQDVDAPSDAARKQADEVAFWGLGLFPVL